MGEVEENTKCRTTENQDCKEILQGKKKLDYKAKYPVDCDPWDVPELGYQV